MNLQTTKQVSNQTPVKLILCFVLVCSGLTLFAATDQPPIYFRAEAGPAFLRTLRADYGIGHFDELSDVGTRFDLTLGYHFTPSLAAELNGGMVWNKLLDMAQHDFCQVPIMLNLLWKPAYGRLAPFVGAGAGAVDLILVPHGFSGLHTESHFVFGAQALAGVGYRISRAWELGLSYRFLGAASDNFRNGGTIRLGPAYSHAIQVEFTFAF
jgi:opacity protein-like surface antigen